MPIEEKPKAVPIERPVEVEKAPEAPKEAPAVEQAERPPAPEAPTPTPFPLPLPTPPPPSKEPLLIEIESVLEEDLAEVYAGLPEKLKPKFKAKGEEVARTIRQMMSQARVQARKVLALLKDWLKMIPGVNKFFLEQEAAIKTQKILTIAKEQKND